MVDGPWGLSIRQQKNHIPTAIWTPDHSAYSKSLYHVHCHTPLQFELQTIQHTVSHCAMYTVTPHQEHNDVNVNDKISDLYGGHFLVSYAMWWLNDTVFWKDVLPTLSELWLAEFAQTSCISDIFHSIPSFSFLPEPFSHWRCRQYIHLKQI